jgi:hypothetical protein
MRSLRRCDNRCHQAKGIRCQCWCGGSLHGASGAVNREALQQAVSEAEKRRLLEKHGFKPGETVYLEQRMLPLFTEEDKA